MMYGQKQQLPSSSQTTVDSAVGCYGTSKSDIRAPSKGRDAKSQATSNCHQQSPILGSSNSGVKTRKIRLYRNGDPFFGGHTMVMAHDNRTFDSLLVKINESSVADPAILTKGVRYLFTLDGKPISSLNDLVDGQGYVCSSTTAFRRIDYQKIHNPSWVSQYKASIKGLGEMDSKKAASKKVPSCIVPRMVWVFRAGPRPRTHVKTLLNKRTARSFEQVLSDLANQIKETGPIKTIYSLNGNQLTCLKDFFEEDWVFIAFGSVKFSTEELQLNDEENKLVEKAIARKENRPQQNTSKRLVTITATDLQHQPVSVPQPVVHLEDSRVNDEDSSPQRLLNHYQLGKILLNSSGTVIRKCEDRMFPNSTHLVAKIVGKNSLSPDQIQRLALEVEIMQKLHHDNIVEVLFEDETCYSVYQVFETSMGVDLLDFVFSRSKYSERDASNLLSQIMAGIQYLHSLNIVHRNINPTNILVDVRPNGSWHVKLYDLAYATLTSDELNTFQCGTPAYMSPEMIRGSGYGLKSDIWSTGVIAYILLCGFNPFSGDTKEQVFQKIRTGQVEFPSPHWDNISNLAKDLVVYMLEEFPQVRSSASEVLDHPWISKTIASDVDFHSDISEHLYQLIESRPSLHKTPCLAMLASSSVNTSVNLLPKIAPQGNANIATLPNASPDTISKLMPLSTLTMAALNSGLSLSNSTAGHWLKTSNVDKELGAAEHRGEGESKTENLVPSEFTEQCGCQ